VLKRFSSLKFILKFIFNFNFNLDFNTNFTLKLKIGSEGELQNKILRHNEAVIISQPSIFVRVDP
jgi:hypothetical protein